MKQVGASGANFGVPVGARKDVCQRFFVQQRKCAILAVVDDVLVNDTLVVLMVVDDGPAGQPRLTHAQEPLSKNCFLSFVGGPRLDDARSHGQIAPGMAMLLGAPPASKPISVEDSDASMHCGYKESGQIVPEMAMLLYMVVARSSVCSALSGDLSDQACHLLPYLVWMVGDAWRTS
eukprot:11089-Pelagomonas_calceolata.AAC.4